MHKHWVWMIAILILISVACSRQKPKRVVARINGAEITREDFRDRLLSLPSQMQVLYAYEEGHREFLDSIVEQKLLYQEAKRRDLEKDPVVKSRIDNYVEQTRVTIKHNIEKLQQRLDEIEAVVEENLLAKEMLDRARPEALEISEEELGEYYQKIKKRLLKTNPQAEIPDLGMVRRDLRRQLVKKKFVEGLKQDADLELYYERLAPDLR